MRSFAMTLAFFLAFGAQARDKDRGDEYEEGFRAGFKEGYKEGLAEAERRAVPVAVPVPVEPPKPRPTGPITISTAFYGTTSKSCDATRWLAKRVNGRRSASVEVSNAICGDPAPGARKSLEITYICGSLVKNASAYEHRTAYLDCNG